MFDLSGTQLNQKKACCLRGFFASGLAFGLMTLWFFGLTTTITYAQTVETLTTVDSSPWTVPADVYSVTIECWGGGGGGGDSNNVPGGSGGGGGGYARTVLSVTPSETLAFSVGTGGAAGAAGNQTTFNSTSCVANGGGAGADGGGTPGAGGTGTGDVSYTGGTGGTGNTTAGGGGGSSAGTASDGTDGVADGSTTASVTGGGDGGPSAPANTDGTAGSVPGGGGAGAGYDASGGPESGAGGANGQIRLTYSAGMTINGTLYSDEGQTVITSSKTIKVRIGTSTPSTHTVSTDGSGSWSVDLDPANIYAGLPYVVWVDGDSTVKANVVGKFNSAGPVSDIDLYQGNVIVRHEGTGTSTTLADFDTYDSGNDPDILYAVTPGETFTIATGTLYIWTGDTFESDGLVTLPGGLVASTSAVYIASATGTRFIATSTGNTIDIKGNNLGSTTFDGVGGEWTMTSSASTSDLTIENGTLVAPSALTVSGNYTNNDTFTAGSGTVFFSGLGDFNGFSTDFLYLKSKDVSVNGNFHEGLEFSKDGTRMYVTDYSAGDTFEWSLSTPWDVGSAQYVDSFNFPFTAYDVAFSDDGTIFYVSNQADEIVEYTVGTPWDISTASKNASTSIAGAMSGQAKSIFVTPDGGQLFVVDSTSADVHEYPLSTAYDLTSIGSVTSHQFSLTYCQCWGIEFNDDGSKFYLANGVGEVEEYDLSIAYDLSSRTGVGTTSLSSNVAGARDIEYSTNGASFYFMDSGTPDSVDQFAAGTSLISGNLTGSSAFNDVTLSGGRSLFDGAASTSNLTVTSGSSLNGGTATIGVSGDLLVNGVFTASTSEIIFTGTTQQTVSGTLSGSNAFNDLRLRNTSQNGTTSRSVLFNSAIDVDGTMYMTDDTSVGFAAGATSTISTANWVGTSSNPVWIYSTATGTTAGVVINDSYTLQGLTIRDINSCGSVGGGITVVGAVDAGNNFCWTITDPSAITVSGTVYAEDGITPITGGPTVKLVLGTSSPSVLSTTANGSGQFTFNPVNTSIMGTGSFISVFVDASTTLKANTFTTLANKNDDVIGLDLIANTVVIRSEYNGTTTLALLEEYDQDSDADIVFDANSQRGEFIVTDSLNLIASGTTLLLLASSTLAGDLEVSDSGGIRNYGIIHLVGNGTISGNLTGATGYRLGRLDIQGTYTMSHNASTTQLQVTNGGSFTSSANLTPGRLLKDDSSTFDMSAGKLFFDGSSGFRKDMRFIASSTFDAQTPDNFKGLNFSTDGRKLIIMGGPQADRALYQYELSTPWDISSRTYTGTIDLNIGFRGSPEFSPDGSLMYIINPDRFIDAYELLTPWDITTAVAYGTSPVPVTGFQDVRDFVISLDGTRLIARADWTSGDHIFELTMSTPWDITTLAADSQTSVGSNYFFREANESLDFTPDGLRMVMSGGPGGLNGVVYKNLVFYELTTPYDFTTATYDDFRHVGNLIGDDSWDLPYTVRYTGDGTKLILRVADGTLAEYYIFDVSGTEVVGDFTGSSALGEVIVVSGTTTFAGTASTSDFTINPGAVVEGPKTTLEVMGDYTNNGTFLNRYGELAVSGVGATVSGNLVGNSEIYDLEIGNSVAFSNAASTSAVYIRNSGNFTAPGNGLTVKGDLTNDGTFSNNSGTLYMGADGFDFENVLDSDTILLSEITAADGIALSQDGTKMYITSNNPSPLRIYEYDLNVPFDITTRSFATSTPLPQSHHGNGGSFDITFSDDGTSLIIYDRYGDTWGQMDEYSLSTPWDVSTSSVSYVDSFSLEVGTFSAPYGVAFSTDGLNLFAPTYNALMHYSLGTAWDVSTLSYTASSSFIKYQTYPNGVFVVNDEKIVFPSGTHLYMDVFTISDITDISTLEWEKKYRIKDDISYGAAVHVAADGSALYTNQGEGQQLKLQGKQKITGRNIANTEFNNLVFNGRPAVDWFGFATTTNLIIGSNATVNAGTSTMAVLGEVVIDGVLNASSSHVILAGTGPQTATGTMTGTNQFYDLTIRNTSGNGTTSRSVTFNAPVTATGTMSIEAGSSVAFLANATATFANVNWSGTEPLPVWVYSTATGTQYNLVATGTLEYVNSRDSNACGSPGGGVSTAGGLDVANNTCWTFTSGEVTPGTTVTWDGGASTVNWEDAANWSGDAVPTADDDVVIDTEVYVELNGSTTINSLQLGSSTAPVASILSFAYNATSSDPLIIDGGDFVIHASATLTHASGTLTTATATIDIDIQTGNLTINAGGSIDVSGAGYDNPFIGDGADGYGPGAGQAFTDNSASGAAHGGDGGVNGSGLAGGTAYGSTTNPQSFGSSGGGTRGGQLGGAGGGLAVFAVNGTTTIDGVIAANGENGGSATLWPASGGAGGGINITTGGLEGTGSVTADGGDGYTSTRASGGAGGGRIAIVYNSGSTTHLTFTAFGGVANGGGGESGGAGTIFTKSGAQTNGEVLIDNNEVTTITADTDVSGIGNLDLFTATGSALVEVGATNPITFTDIVSAGSANVVVATGTTLSYTTLDIGSAGIITERGVINFPSSFTVETGGEMRLDRARSFSNLTVDGTLSHSPNTTTQTYILDVDVTGDVTINSGGSIDVAQRGYSSLGGDGQGPGAGDYQFDNGGSGGAYGGDGGPTENLSSVGGSAYGSTTNPRQIGSSGGEGRGVRGGAGGGLAILSVTGTTTVNGTVTADGEGGFASGSYASGGGAGGGINITTGGLEGVGSITALGGISPAAGIREGGGGGGGRIALQYTSGSTTNLSISAYGGSAPNATDAAAAGTIYTKSASQTLGDVLVDNNDITIGTYYTTDSLNTETYIEAGSFDTLTVQNGARVPLATSTSVQVSIGTTTIEDSTVTFDVNDFATSSVLSFVSSGTLVVASGTTFAYETLDGWENNSTIVERGVISSVPSSYTIPSGAMYVADRARSFSDVTVAGVLTHSQNNATQEYALDLDITGDLTVSSGGEINVSERGYAARSGNDGQGPGAGDYQFDNGGSGGAYGGDGGPTENLSTYGGLAYGSTTNPTQIGSSGGAGRNTIGGNGGGLAILDVNGTTTIDGSISADGQAASFSGTYAGGGGSGGAINLTTGGLEGTGTLSVVGGTTPAAGIREGGGGGGGRLVLRYTTGSTTNLTMNAYGGASPNAGDEGAAGTIFTKSSFQTYGDVLIDNNGSTAVFAKTPVATGTASIALDSLTISGNASATIPTILTLYGDYTNEGTASFLNNSTTTFAGTALQTATGTMTGASAFSNVEVTNVSGTDPQLAPSITFGTPADFNTFYVDTPGVMVQFAHAATTTMQDFVIAGSEADYVYLYSDESGTAWNLDVLGTSTIDYAHVKDSNAADNTSGVIYQTNSFDAGGNTNWSGFGAGGGEDVAQVWNASDWTLHDTITIDTVNIDDDLTDFPVYVDLADLSAAFWATTPSGSAVGNDIRITVGTTTGSTELPRELVYASSTTQTGELHFKANGISSTTDTVFYLWYNGTTTDDYTTSATYGAENVWSNAYAAVWHMNQDPSTESLVDSTKYNNDGTSEGTMTADDLVSARMGYGIDFDGVDDAFNLGSITTGSSLMAAGADITMTAVINHDRTGDIYQRIFDKSDGGNAANGYAFSVNGATEDGAVRMMVNTPNAIPVSSFVPQNQSSHLVNVFDDSANQVTFYIDDISEVVSSFTGTIPSATTIARIGTWNHDVAREFNGVIDELRIATTTRSTAWVSAEYLNQSTTTDFYTVAMASVGSASATTSLADSDAGQAQNALDFRNKTDELLFTFKLSVEGENATVTDLILDYIDIHGIENGEITDVTLYVDENNDGELDGGDTLIQIGDTNFTGETGSTTFTADFVVSSTSPSNYLVTADISSIERGDEFTVTLLTSGISATGQVSELSTNVHGSVDDVTHFRSRNYGGGGSRDGFTDEGAPGAGLATGGTNEGGEELGGVPNFNTPSTTGNPHNEWTGGDNVKISDGVYATETTVDERLSLSDFSYNIQDSYEIVGIEVKLEASAVTGTGTIGVALSWDGGVSTTTAKFTPELTNTDTIYTLGGASDTWGRSWTANETTNANFRVRLVGQSSEGNIIQVDAVSVRIYNQIGGGGLGGGSGEI